MEGLSIGIMKKSGIARLLGEAARDLLSQLESLDDDDLEHADFMQTVAGKGHRDAYRKCGKGMIPHFQKIDANGKVTGPLGPNEKPLVKIGNRLVLAEGVAMGGCRYAPGVVGMDAKKRRRRRTHHRSATIASLMEAPRRLRRRADGRFRAESVADLGFRASAFAATKKQIATKKMLATKAAKKAQEGGVAAAVDAAVDAVAAAAPAPVVNASAENKAKAKKRPVTDIAEAKQSRIRNYEILVDKGDKSKNTYVLITKALNRSGTSVYKKGALFIFELRQTASGKKYWVRRYQNPPKLVPEKKRTDEQKALIAKLRNSAKAYRASEKGKASLSNYRKSEKGKASLSNYRKSAKGKVALSKYRQSAKGKAALSNYRKSAKGKAAASNRFWKKRCATVAHMGDVECADPHQWGTLARPGRASRKGTKLDDAAKAKRKAAREFCADGKNLDDKKCQRLARARASAGARRAALAAKKLEQLNKKHDMERDALMAEMGN
jgi:hypothetical protein